MPVDRRAAGAQQAVKRDADAHPSESAEAWKKVNLGRGRRRTHASHSDGSSTSHGRVKHRTAARTRIISSFCGPSDARSRVTSRRAGD